MTQADGEEEVATDEQSKTAVEGTSEMVRIITLRGDITWEAVGDFADHLAALNAEEGEGDARIAVQIASPGGNLMAGLAIYDLIALNSVPVVTEAFGLAGSAAAIIFQAGHLRLMAPHARLMIHMGHMGLEGTFNADELGEAHGEVSKKDLLVARLFAKRTGQPIARIRAWCKEETEFDALEAVEHGFADGIIVPSFLPAPRRRKHPKRAGKTTRRAKRKKS